MCGPLALAAIPATLGVVQAGMDFVGGQQAYHANRIAANTQYASTYNTAQQQAGQTNVKQSQDTVSNVIDAAQRFGRIAAGASSIGLGAGTVGAAVNASGVLTGRRQGAISFNANSERNQIGNEVQGANLRRTSQINSVQKPSLLGLMVGIGKAATSGGNTYYASGGKNLGGDIAALGMF